MKKMEIKIPSVGESVSSADIESWEKNTGDRVSKGEVIAILETDKASMEIQAEQDGILNILKGKGETASVGESIGFIEPDSKERAKERDGVVGAKALEQGLKQSLEQGLLEASNRQTSFQNTKENLSPSVRRIVEAQGIDPLSMQGTGRGGRLTKEDILKALSEGEQAATKESQIKGEAVEGAEKRTGESTAEEVKIAATAELEKASMGGIAVRRAKEVRTEGERVATGEKMIGEKMIGEKMIGEKMIGEKKTARDVKPLIKEGQRRERMTSLRRKTARKLVQSQLSTATLSTFNEADMSRIIEIRNKHKEEFIQKHGIKLGFMSFFVKAVVSALCKYPKLNAFIDGEDIIYNNHQHIGIAVSTDKGLVVPVLFNAQDLSFAEIEKKIIEFRDKALARKLSVDDLFGGTFTISNGGVFGSLLSTPVLNPPQSGILGMHKIQARPVAVNSKVEIRPMMYLALSYDHQMVDGKESVGFLSELKSKLEEPARLWIDT